MEPKPNNLGEYIRAQMDHLDVQLPASSWDAIEPHLPKKEKKRRFIIWFWLGGLLFIFGTGIYSWPTSNNTSSSQSNPNTSGANTTKENPMYAPEIKPEKTSGVVMGKRNLKVQKQGSITAQKKTESFTFLTPKKGRKNQKKGNSYKVKVTEEYSLPNKKNTPQVVDSITSNPSEIAFILDGTLQPEAMDSLCWDFPIMKKNTRKEKKENNKSEEDQEAKQKHTFWIFPYAGPMLLSVSGDDQLLVNQNALNKKQEITLTYGLQIRWMLNENWGLQIGIGKMQGKQSLTFSNQNIAFNTYNLETSWTQNELNNQFIGLTDFTLKRDFTYWEIPMEAYYEWGQKKWNIATSAGFSYLAQTQNSITGINTNGSSFYIGNVYSDTRNSMTINAKVHFQYLWKKNWRFEIVPTFQYHFITNTQQTQLMNYWFSIRSGVSYQLPF
ncbi:MAG: hypothetical protein RLZZ500_491 [Bacteroidota bacterium]|jgi:hypothetical protein